VSDPDVTDAVFDQPEPGGAGFLVRVSMGGTGFEARAVPVQAQVGNVPVEAIILQDTCAVGFLRAVPPVGATLRIGYADRELVDTPFTFPGLPNA
jgi:hypothetical protein